MRSLFSSDEDLDEILADDNNHDNAENDGDMSGSNDDDDTNDDMVDDGNPVENNDDDGDGNGDATNTDDDVIDGDNVNGADHELTTDSQSQVSQLLFSPLDPSMSQATPPESPDSGPIRTLRRTFSRRQPAPMP